MCGRYTYYSSSDILTQFGLKSDKSPQTTLAFDYPDNYNVAPGSTMPIIIRGSQEYVIEFAVWGLVPSWSKDIKTGMKLINARRESLLEKRMWRQLVKSKRCVVPARGFYEWKSIDTIKQPFYITPANGDYFSFAGLYDEWHDDNGNTVISYCIITTNSNKKMSEIHSRMPAILTKGGMDMWLEPISLKEDQLSQLLAPAAEDSITVFKVSRDVSNPRNNSKDLIYPLDD